MIELLTVDEVAKVLHVSKMTVYRMVKTEELTAITIKRSIRIPAAALDAYLAAHTTGGAS